MNGQVQAANAEYSRTKTKDQLVKEYMGRFSATKFHAMRIAELVQNYSTHTIQIGRVPDLSAIETRSLSIEKDLPQWLSSDLLGESMVSLRVSSDALPTLAKIVEEAKAIMHSAPKPHEEPVVRAIQHDDKWANLVTHRLLLQSAGLLKFASSRKDLERLIEDLGAGIPNPGAWISDMVVKEPTAEEAMGFVRMIAKEASRSARALLYSYWGDRNPYGISTHDLKNLVRAQMAAQPVNSEAWELPM